MTREPADLNVPELRDRAVRAARGEAPFDLLLTGGQVVDVALGEVRAADVGLVGPLIASVHPPGSRTEAATSFDAAGRLIAPGLIDTHLHIESSMVTPRRYAETVVPQGTTTICWDPHEVGNVLGLEGVRWAIGAARDLPLRILVLAPSCVPSAPGLERAGAAFEAAEMHTMLAWNEVAGVAEVMDMRGVLERSAHMAGIVGAGLASGKLVCGHARGLAGGDLQGFAAAGIESDHEITSGDDLLAKLRAGFTIELRGSHDLVLPGAVAALRSLPHVPADADDLHGRRVPRRSRGRRRHDRRAAAARALRDESARCAARRHAERGNADRAARSRPGRARTARRSRSCSMTSAGWM